MMTTNYQINVIVPWHRPRLFLLHKIQSPTSSGAFRIMATSRDFSFAPKVDIRGHDSHDRLVPTETSQLNTPAILSCELVQQKPRRKAGVLYLRDSAISIAR
jgi:hypothetical protein